MPEPAPDLAALLARIDAILRGAGIAGAGIALVNADGTAWSGGVGAVALGGAKPVTATTSFRLGSLSKSLTAVAVMEQVEGGRLSLDDRLAAIAPEVPFHNPWEATNPVRVSNLLEHTAGFEIARFNEDLDPGPTPRSLAAALALNPSSRSVRWPPGTRMAYSNEGYLVAGYLLEKVTGRSFDDVLADGVIKPLGMTGAAFRLTPDAAANLATGYLPDGSAPPYREDAMRPAAGLLGTPADLVRYLQFWLDGGSLDGHRLLSAGSLERMLTRQTLPYPGPAEQYGLGTDTQQFGGFIAHGHLGATYGYAASLRFIPSQHVGWAVMLNSSDPGQARAAIDEQLASFLLRGMTAPRSVEVSAMPEELTGYYQDQSPPDRFTTPISDLFSGRQYRVTSGRLEQRVFSAGGFRAILQPGPWEPLASTGGGGYRSPGQSASSLLFVEGGGDKQVVTEFGNFGRIPLWQVLAGRALLFLAIALSASSVVALGLWVGPAVLAGRTPSLVWTWLLPAAAAAAGLAATWLFNRYEIRQGDLNPTTVAIFALSLAFALFAPTALVAWLLAPVSALGPLGALVKGYGIAVSLALVGLGAFALSAGWIGLRTWAW